MDQGGNSSLEKGSGREFQPGEGIREGIPLWRRIREGIPVWRRIREGIPAWGKDQGWNSSLGKRSEREFQLGERIREGIPAWGKDQGWNSSLGKVLSFRRVQIKTLPVKIVNVALSLLTWCLPLADEDEDGDRITVRSDEEMKAMLSYYYSTVMEQQVNGQLIEPLQIYPRACKPPGKRNIHGLKVRISIIVSGKLDGFMNEQDIRYRDILGHGNGGTVYKAYHVRSGKILAVKVIPLDITLELQKQIMSELEILYKCDSSYIIGFYGAFFTPELFPWGSLDVYRKIPEHVLGRIAVAVVKGLTYLWSLKILHRDVKPSNMLVNTRGQVKLCDFGVSTQLVNSIAKTYVGTNAYMAPERISGEQYGIHSDVWSLGISFMEVCTDLGCSLLLCTGLQQEISWMDSGLYHPLITMTRVFCGVFLSPAGLCVSWLTLLSPLQGHPFVVQYNDGNAEVVSMWVCRMLEERRAQGAQ
uniref:mitogen-activated protein kinase kinase n=1 Tax=Zosterops lateralis melanops TaxID=1220523 RepID=A0A8D2NWR8_ZOSLA